MSTKKPSTLAALAAFVLFPSIVSAGTASTIPAPSPDVFSLLAGGAIAAALAVKLRRK